MKRLLKYCLLGAGILLLGYRIFLAIPDERFVGVVVDNGQDTLRTTEYVNGIRLIADKKGSIKVRLLRIEDNEEGRKKAKDFAREKGCTGIMTTLSYPEEFTPWKEIPVVTTSKTRLALSMKAEEQDEVTALLSYMEEVDMDSKVLMIPEESQSRFIQWIPKKLEEAVFVYEDNMLGIAYEFSELDLDRVDGVLVWGDDTQVPGVIMKLRHAGYTGVILGPSFLEEYDALGVNAGQASGLFFASQYLNAKQVSEPMGERQQEFIQEYTEYFKEAPLFRESFLGADQMLLVLEMLDRKGEVDKMQGVVQVYDYEVNERTGNVNMVVYEIQGGYVGEAR